MKRSFKDLPVIGKVEIPIRLLKYNSEWHAGFDSFWAADGTCENGDGALANVL